MSCVLDKFKNEVKGFCHSENMQFFIYMMEHQCKTEYQIMKDEAKRTQFYLDLMDVLQKSVGVDSIPIKKVFDCSERDFTKKEEEDFIKKNNLQEIKEKTITTLTYDGLKLDTGQKLYEKVTKKQKVTLTKMKHTGYFIDIIKRIPKCVLGEKEVKSKIEETLNEMYKKITPATVDYKNFISVMLFVYKILDLDLSKNDINELWKKVRLGCMYSHNDSSWINSMFYIIFKNRNKFSFDEKKKLLDEVMSEKKRFG